ncbi:head-tail connector protein [Achromobacter kerstersii]|uniref:head-tail connector protein n=1 Tax=Achromobacter kerstersii TaxID=1353890 RepID=UPI003D04695A
MDLVTIELLRIHCRADSTDDSLLEVYGSTAEESAQAYLNRRVFATPEDMAAAVLAGAAGVDPMVVTSTVRAAILLIAGSLYLNREDGLESKALPIGAQALLQPYRVGLGV